MVEKRSDRYCTGTGSLDKMKAIRRMVTQTPGPLFEVNAERELRMLRIIMRGFWDAETMRAYSIEVRNKMAELMQARGCRYILIDMIDFAIQSQAIAEGHAANLRMVRDRGEARVALVMQSALSKLQAARVASDTGHKTFATVAEARAWLLSDQG